MAISKWLRTAAAWLAIAAFWSLLANLGTGGTLNFVESTLRDLATQKSVEERKPAGEIKIIKIDQESLDVLGAFPWDRAYYAQLIEMLAESGAKAIFLDVHMADPGPYPESDAYMADVMDRYDNVYLPVVFVFKAQQEDANSLEVASIEYPAHTIAATKDQVGHINTMWDKDRVVRKLTVGIPDEEGNMIPAMSVRLANAVLPEEERIYWDEERRGWYRGDKRIPVNARYQVTTDFFTKPQQDITADTGYDTISFWQVLSGEVDPEFFRDSLVLIGPYAPGFGDEYAIPNSNVKMYGVEIHANMTQSLINGKFYTESPEWFGVLLIAALTLFSLLLYERFPGLKSVFIYIGLAIAYVLAFLSAYTFGSVFIPFTYPFLALFTALVWAVVSHYLNERRERSRVTNIFGRFVPKTVVDELLASGEEIKVGGQRRDISVMFVDIRGFTPMSERLQPEEVIGVLNEYLDICTKAVFLCNGTLDKFIGDGVMALFGAPIHYPNHPELAIRAALEIRKHANRLEQECIEKWGVGVKFGIGINCGPAVVGNIGSEMLRLDYTAIGDTVNLAARLESNAKPGQILISEEVCNRVGHLFQLEDIGEIKVKGKEKPVRVFAVLGAAEDAEQAGETGRREGA